MAPIEPADFTVAEERVGSAVRLVLTGELDLATTPQLAAALGRLAATGADVVLDLRGLTFIDSRGITLAYTAARDAKRDGWTLSLVPGPPAVQRVFELMGLLDELPFAARGTAAPETAISR